MWLARRTRQRKRAGVTGRPFHGAGTASGGIWCASAITSTAPEIASGVSGRPLRESTIFVTRGLVATFHGVNAPWSQRVAVAARAVLCEVEVQPGRLDVTQQLVLLHVLTVAHGRDDVPVAEGEIAVGDRQRPAALEMHNTGPDRIDRGAVRRRDINPEMERPRRARDPRVVEGAAHRMRPPKRFQRPPVQATQTTRLLAQFQVAPKVHAQPGLGHIRDSDADGPRSSRGAVSWCGDLYGTGNGLSDRTSLIASPRPSDASFLTWATLPGSRRSATSGSSPRFDRVLERSWNLLSCRDFTRAAKDLMPLSG